MLAACLRVAESGDCVLLIEDGAYNVSTLLEVAFAQGVDISGLHCRVLREDLSARGLSEDALPAFVTTADYAEFVVMACAHRQSVHWF